VAQELGRVTTTPRRARRDAQAATGYLGEIRARLKSRPDKRARWDVRPRIGVPCSWIEVSPRGIEVPDQGWKLHVSATVFSDRAVLGAVLPALVQARVPFKVALSPGDLEFLNSGKAGLNQVGKFITVHPSDDEAFVRLAEDLARRTAGLAGPAVPSDRAVQPGGVVYYRYGGFATRLMQTPVGLVVGAIRDPSGAFVEDPRDTAFAPPPWAVDPLVARGRLEPHARASPLLHGRYLCVALLDQSVKGSVHLGLDIESPGADSCVIKQARRHVYLTADGVDALALLRNERAVLEALGDTDVVPRLRDYFQTEDGEEVLVSEHLEGVQLRAHVAARACSGILLADREVRELGLALCGVLEALHRRGVIHRDLKPANFTLAAGGTIKAIDLELAYHSEQTPAALAVSGTRGYHSPQQERGELPTVADDIFGLGSLLYFLCTGLDPALAPRERRHEERPIRLLNPSIGGSLEAVVGRCLRETPEERFATVTDVATALEAGARVAARSVRRRNERADHGNDPALFRSLACLIGTDLCEAAEASPVGVSWTCRHPTSFGSRRRDVQIGAAGIVLALVTLFQASQVERFRRTAKRALAWLADIDYARAPHLPGLLVGESGVGLAFLRAGLAFNQSSLLSSSRRVADAVWAAPPASPDFFNGQAGCGHFLLHLSHALGDQILLGRAVGIGHALLSQAEDDVLWPIPAGYGELSDRRYLGFAHGSAGIGYVLGELFEATGERRFLDTATAVGEHLVRAARPALADGSGANWPDTEEGEVRSLFWCHGAAGIGQFLMRLEALTGGQEFGRMARRAGLMVARGGRWVGPTLCHGLAGNIDFLLDLYQATGEQGWLREAYELAGILRSHAVISGETLTWPSEEPTIITPDFMVGCAGVGHSFARLSRADDLPNWMSCGPEAWRRHGRLAPRPA